MDKKVSVVFSIFFMAINCHAMDGKEENREKEEISAYSPFAPPESYDQSEIFTCDPKDVVQCIERSSRPRELPRGIKLIEASGSMENCKLVISSNGMSFLPPEDRCEVVDSDSKSKNGK